jgi:adenylosuccinate lyase
MSQHSYENPLITRYSCGVMKNIFSEYEKVKTMRIVWFALAESQKELGLPIGCNQIRELELHIESIDFDRIEQIEHQTKHDVMANLLAYGEVAPLANPIIHLGATSTDITDNVDIILMKRAIHVIKQRLINVIDHLSTFAETYKSIPTLGFTHLQPAQLITVGKRATLWISDLLKDLENLDNLEQKLSLKGLKGATGTQASFLSLFDNDIDKVHQLEQAFVRRLGFDRVEPVTSQTYSRKTDYEFMSLLSQIAQSAYKFSNDLRLLQHMKEIEEPFDQNQVGSSSMPYKRNPMRSERISSLARYVISLPINGAITSSTQWLERSLDDSANRRIVLPNAFLATDAILNLYMNITKSLVVYPKMIEKHLKEEFPLMVIENILMASVKNGGDRQLLHEKLKLLTHQVSKQIKENGGENNLFELLLQDPNFKFMEKEFSSLMNPIHYIGLSDIQVVRFLNDYVNPVLIKYRDLKNMSAEIHK